MVPRGELASNDRYLLKNLVVDGVACLDIKPSDTATNAAPFISPVNGR